LESTWHPTPPHDKPKKSCRFRSTGTPADTAADLRMAVNTTGCRDTQVTMHAMQLTSAEPQYVRFKRPLVLDFVGLDGGVPKLQISGPMRVRILDLKSHT
jgi:hypothetical protein